MNEPSSSPAEAAGTPARRGILVWDAPLRVFHWLMVLSFAGAWITAESERWRLLHVTLGYTMAGLVGFRVLWGLAGTRYARFASFVRGPAAVARYLWSILRGKPEHHVGHNPAGALAIVALLVLALATTASGWAVYGDIGGDWLEDLHEGAASLMLAVVVLHVAGVALGSWVHRENLVGAMVSGRKPGDPRDGIRRAWRGVAALMVVAVLGFWWLQWQERPVAAAFAAAPAAAAAESRHDEDD